jgi:hypothetical protein
VELHARLLGVSRVFLHTDFPVADHGRGKQGFVVTVRDWPETRADEDVTTIEVDHVANEFDLSLLHHFSGFNHADFMSLMITYH